MSVHPRESAHFLQEREERRNRELDSLYGAMTCDAKRIVESIAEQFQPSRIYQWGSLLDRSRFQSYSDIDIAVEGIIDAEVWRNVERMAWTMTDYPLDLVQLEHVEPEYVELIRSKGSIVYEYPC